MDRVTFYRDVKEEWRWTRQDEGNFKIIGAASEGFDSYRNAYENAYRNYGDTVEYVRWPIADTGDKVAPVEVEIHDDPVG